MAFAALALTTGLFVTGLSCPSWPWCLRCHDHGDVLMAGEAVDYGYNDLILGLFSP